MNKGIEKITDIIERNSFFLDTISTGLKPELKKMNHIRCVLFDIYGTLFISASGDINNTSENLSKDSKIKQLLEDFAIEGQPGELRRQFIDAVKKKHKELKEQGIDYPEVRYEDIWAQVLDIEDIDYIKKFAVTYESIVNPVYPMPGLISTLKTLQNNKIVMGVISNAQFFTPHLFPAFLNFSLPELGFDQNLLFFSYEWNYAKPSLFMYIKVKNYLSNIGVLPKEVLYVGNDMLNDVYPAKNTGFSTALFAGDQRSLRLRKNDARCKNITPDLILTRLAQIPDCIKERGNDVHNKNNP